MDTHLLTDDLAESGSVPDMWKSNLVYTGDNLVYPVEMFIALMENKIKRSPDTIDATKEVLSYIPTISTTSVQNNDESCISTAIWKHKHSNRLSKLHWNNLKKELLSEFGQHKRYNMKEKLKFLYSSKMGYKEETENYLIRINMIVSYIEHGKISHIPPNNVWVQLLYMMGMSNQHSLFLSNDSNDQYHNDRSEIKFLDNYCCFLDDFQDNGTIEENIENATLQNENKKQMLQQMNPNDEVSDKEKISKDSSFELYISRTEEESRSDLEVIVHRENIYTSLNMIEQEERENLLVDVKGEEFQETICSINECKKEGESLSKGKSATKELVPCKICGANYTLKCQEARHRLSKNGLEEFCDMGLISFNNTKECRDDQMESHHEGTTCEICDLSFNTMEELNKHQGERHEGKQYKCKLCGSEMLYQSVNHHVNTVHYDERTCEVTKRKRKLDVSRFNQVTEIKDDPLLRDLSYSPLNCTIQDGLTTVKRKTSELLHFCGICNKKMKSVKELRTHCNNEHEGKRLKCNNCNFTSKAPHELARHLLRAHHMETEGYEVLRCSYPGCKYKCIEKHKFQTHIDGVHKGLRTFKCNACDKSFSQKGTLKLHVQGVHMGLRKWKCDDCEKEFHQKSLLDLHKSRIHGIGELPKHVCYVCGSVFTTQSNLGKHLSRSHGIFKRKEYKRPEVECPHCHKMYFKYLLKRHIRRMHQEFREYPCCHCDKEYPDKNELKRHILLDHLKARPFRCKLCKKEFKKGWDLNYHICSAHEGQTTKEARSRCSSMGASHPAFEKVAKEELDTLLPVFDMKEDVFSVANVLPLQNQQGVPQ